MDGIYSVYDRVAELHGPVFEARNDGVATRVFKRVVAQAQRPADEYMLFHLGTINLENGQVQGSVQVRRVEVVSTSSPSRHVGQVAEGEPDA